MMMATPNIRFDHYDNMPMQYTDVMYAVGERICNNVDVILRFFSAVKIVNFR